MPQDGLETLVRGTGSGGDGRRVTCETLFNSDDAPPDFPPESFYISKESELDWYDRNVFYERKESAKGISISNSNSNPNPISQRISSTKSKTSIIGLPKPQISTFSDTKIRRNAKPCHFFPRRLGSAGKFSLRMNEPSSPRVSCMGKVRSRNRNRVRRSTEKTQKSTDTKPRKKTGLWSSFKQILWFSCRTSHAVDVDVPSVKSSTSKKNVKDELPLEGDGVVQPPGLGGLNRFVSGRRSDSWAGDAVDLEKTHDDS